eukprot:scaffold66283_cov51-Attheya_sp.AAC.1
MSQEGDGGTPPVAMVNGASSTDRDELKFDDVSALKRSQQNMEDYFKALLAEQVTLNEATLHIEGTIFDILDNHFRHLETADDWQTLCVVLATQFEKQLESRGFAWDTKEALPVNTNDLAWKTKLRFLNLSAVKHFFADGQKRGCSKLRALMGTRPVKRIVDCR